MSSNNVIKVLMVGYHTNTTSGVTSLESILLKLSKKFVGHPVNLVYCLTIGIIHGTEQEIRFFFPYQKIVLSDKLLAEPSTKVGQRDFVKEGTLIPAVLDWSRRDTLYVFINEELLKEEVVGLFLDRAFVKTARVYITH